MAEANAMPCHWVKDEDGTEFMIPGCHGGAVDPSGCTCEIRGSELDLALRAKRQAERHVERLRDLAQRQKHEYTQLFNMNRRLRERIAELEAKNANMQTSQV